MVRTWLSVVTLAVKIFAVLPDAKSFAAPCFLCFWFFLNGFSTRNYVVMAPFQPERCEEMAWTGMHPIKPSFSVIYGPVHNHGSEFSQVGHLYFWQQPSG
jgi:hypothetical protein